MRQREAGLQPRRRIVTVTGTSGMSGRPPCRRMPSRRRAERTGASRPIARMPRAVKRDSVASLGRDAGNRDVGRFRTSTIVVEEPRDQRVDPVV